jgi:hypothetical protein
MLCIIHCSALANLAKMCCDEIHESTFVEFSEKRDFSDLRFLGSFFVFLQNAIHE